MACVQDVIPRNASLRAPPAPIRKPSQRLARPSDALEDFISSDLEQSFASTMSLNSPPRSPERDPFAAPDLLPDQHLFLPAAMDSSPIPVSKMSHGIAIVGGRPRLNAGTRAFGRELLNGFNDSPIHASLKSSRHPNERPSLPAEWICEFPHMENPPSPILPASDAMDIMDVDDCILPPELTRPPSSDDPTVTLSSTSANSGISALFFDESSPEPSPKLTRPLKLRSVSPEGSAKLDDAFLHRQCNDDESYQSSFEVSLSSSPVPPSPSKHGLEHFATVGGGGGLFSKFVSAKPPQESEVRGDDSFILNSNRRIRRPTISALSFGDGTSQNDAFGSRICKDKDISTVSHARRAFSTTTAMVLEPPSSDSGSDVELEFSPAAQALAKRQIARNTRRRHGTDQRQGFNGAGTFRPFDPTAKSPLRQSVLASPIDSPSARWLKGGGLPGFGDNEARGKALPCERVSEDGLMRIDVHTLDALITGKYDDRIDSYRIVDCRFDYEYQGGHIKGAININTIAEIDELLLGDNAQKPEPSCSGDLKKKTVLIFHCEFSAKRGPTFAKHLRSKDRAMNNHKYPKIYYPEVYVLKGGYNQYFYESGLFSEPHGYVRMDDPQFARDRREELDQFRTKTRFGRTKSYAYGETMKSSLIQQTHQSHHQRKTDPAGAGTVASIFAAANAARSRRSSSNGEADNLRLMTVKEDANSSILSSDGDDSFNMDGVLASPCPPASKYASMKTMGISMMLGSSKASANSGRSLQRAQTFAQCR